MNRAFCRDMIFKSLSINVSHDKSSIFCVYFYEVFYAWNRMIFIEAPEQLRLIAQERDIFLFLADIALNARFCPQNPVLRLENGADAAFSNPLQDFIIAY